jgi:hypothetical protein
MVNVGRNKEDFEVRLLKLVLRRIYKDLLVFRDVKSHR